MVNRDWLRPWVAASPDGRRRPRGGRRRVSFAIMDYGHPGRSRASANIGDHVQSLASLGTWRGTSELTTTVRRTSSTW